MRVWLDHHWAIQPTAEALYVHRNTLQKRLRRIETLLGLDLQDPDDIVELYLGLRATQLLGEDVVIGRARAGRELAPALTHGGSVRRDDGRQALGAPAGPGPRSARSRATEPALCSGSLRLPHLGLCTQLGQPLSQGQAATSGGGVGGEALEGLVAASGESPMPPG